MQLATPKELLHATGGASLKNHCMQLASPLRSSLARAAAAGRVASSALAPTRGMQLEDNSASWHAHRLATTTAGGDTAPDWVEQLDLRGARALAASLPNSAPPKFLVLYGSLRTRSCSRFLAHEFARILEHLGATVRVFDPAGLPQHDAERESEHAKVRELRALSQWSEGHVWVSPEQHGAISGVFKSQIDWIPLALGSVRPTQGRTLAVAQVNGGSQSFNAVNTLRLLGRWMRMVTVPNQASVPEAWLKFDAGGRMTPGSHRDRVVDVAEELFKFTLLTRDHTSLLVDRFSEREEVKAKGRLLSQAEKVAAAAAAAVGVTAAAAAPTVARAATVPVDVAVAAPGGGPGPAGSAGPATASGPAACTS